MKPALHRSITFWSGILVMAFIVWAWRDSVKTPRLWQRGLGFASEVRVAHCEGAFHVIHKSWTNPKSARLGPAKTGWGERINGDSVRYFISMEPKVTGGLPAPGFFPAPWGGTRRCEVPIELSRGPDVVPTVFTGIILPHWLMLLGVAIPWAALLLRRAQRRRRAVSP